MRSKNKTSSSNSIFLHKLKKDLWLGEERVAEGSRLPLQGSAGLAPAQDFLAR